MKTLIKTCGCGLTFREEKEGTGKCPACVAKASSARQDDVVRAAGTSEGAKKGWESRDFTGVHEQHYSSEGEAEKAWKSVPSSGTGKLPDGRRVKINEVEYKKGGGAIHRLHIEATDTASTDIIHCRSHSSAAGDKLGASEPWKCGERVEFMFMPAGTHTINAGFRNGSIELTVQCDEQTAGAVQASLDQWRQERPKQEPFGCVEHREHEASVRVSASGGFSWKEDGVYLAAEPTTLGAENVNGKVHRSWSPSFTTDADYDKAKEVHGSGGVTLVFPEGVRGSRSNPASITGVDFCVGTLTNKPAFHAMSPVKSSEEVQATWSDAARESAHDSRMLHHNLSEIETDFDKEHGVSMVSPNSWASKKHGLYGYSTARQLRNAIKKKTTVKSSEAVTAAGTSEGARKGWLSRQGEFTSIAKSKGHVAFFKDPHGMAHELYKDSSGNLYRAPHDNVMDVTTKNRIGRWEAPPHTADRAAKMLLEDVWATDQEFEDSIHAHCSHLLLNDVPDATPEELAAYDRVVDTGGSHQQAVEECRTKRKHAAVMEANETPTLDKIYAERKSVTATANSIAARECGRPTLAQVYAKRSVKATWSDAARKAAAEARRNKTGGVSDVLEEKGFSYAGSNDGNEIFKHPSGHEVSVALGGAFSWSHKTEGSGWGKSLSDLKSFGPAMFRASDKTDLQKIYARAGGNG